MHQALYRKWRPRQFSDVCGQEHITSVLVNEIETGRINHAYLFCGSRGTGKTTCAKILAKAVNCTDFKNGCTCGKCAACLTADDGSAADIIEMDAASNNGVSNIRDIRDEVNYLPGELKYRVYIIDEVHMLSASAFNALLKTLEEPPSHVIFILATTELQKLPATIISRCQRFDFRRIPASVIADRLTYISGEEGFFLDYEAALMLAKLAEGGMRDAISLLELCANSAPDSRVTEALVSELVGAGDREAVADCVRAICERDFDALFGITSKIYMSSRDITVFWQSLIGYYRDMLVCKSSGKAKDYLELSDAKFSALREAAERFELPTLMYHIGLLDEAYVNMQRGVGAKRLCAESTLVRMCDERVSQTSEAVIARLSALETRVDALASGVRPSANIKAQTSDITDALPSETEAVTEMRLETVSGTVSETASVVASDVASGTASVSDGKPKRRLVPVSYYAEAVERFARDFPLEGAYLDEGRAYREDNGRIRVRLGSEFALGMVASDAAYAKLLEVFNGFESGRLDKNTLVLESVETVSRDSYIDEIIDSTEREKSISSE